MLYTSRSNLYAKQTVAKQAMVVVEVKKYWCTLCIIIIDIHSYTRIIKHVLMFFFEFFFVLLAYFNEGATILFKVRQIGFGYAVSGFKYLTNQIST